MRSYEIDIHPEELPGLVEWPASSSNFGVMVHHNLGTPFVSVDMWHQSSGSWLVDRPDQWNTPISVDENTVFISGTHGAPLHVRVSAP